MASVTLDAKALTEALGNITKNLPKQMGRITYRVATQGRTYITNEIAADLNVRPKKVIREEVSVRKLWPNASVTLNRSLAFPLKRFKPKQQKKGVKVKVLKSVGFRLIPGAFGPNIQALGGHVYKRKGKARLPIRRLHGLSPWGAFKKKKLTKPTARHIEDKLADAINKKLTAERLKQRNLPV